MTMGASNGYLGDRANLSTMMLSTQNISSHECLTRPALSLQHLALRGSMHAMKELKHKFWLTIKANNRKQLVWHCRCTGAPRCTKQIIHLNSSRERTIWAVLSPQPCQNAGSSINRISTAFYSNLNPSYIAMLPTSRSIHVITLHTTA